MWQWYFAYGSNLCIKHLHARIGVEVESRRCRLEGYRLAFNKRGSNGNVYADIQPDPSGSVWGAIYRCDERMLQELDAYEGVCGGHYTRGTVQVLTDAGEALAAMAYFAGERFLCPPAIPKSDYLMEILTGAADHALPADYVAMIRRLAEQTCCEH